MKKNKNNLLYAIILFIIGGGIIQIFLSIPFYPLTQALKQGGISYKEGVSIKRVIPGSPSASAGLLEGDKILSANNLTVTSPEEFVKIIKTNEGKELSIIIQRSNTQMTKKLTPRANPNPTEGRIGAELTDKVIKKQPLPLLIPSVLLRAYSGTEERPLFFGLDSITYQDTSYTRLKSLIFGIINLVVGIGLWKYKKWALYGYFVINGISFFLSIYTFITTITNERIAQPVFSGEVTFTTILYLVIGISLEIFLVYYLYNNRKVFTK